MRLWTIQPAEVLDIIRKTGVYRCDTSKSDGIINNGFETAYTYMAEQMRNRIGPPPPGVDLPVWAWYKWDWQHRRPDMRLTDFKYHAGPHALIELELPFSEVLLSDHTTWHIVLNNGYYDDSTNEEEFDANMAAFHALPIAEQESIKHASWSRIFDITPVETEWASNGKYVQATFWELKQSNIKQVWEYPKKK